MGSKTAKGFGDRNELGPRPPNMTEAEAERHHKMDYYNNARGRFFGQYARDAGMPINEAYVQTTRWCLLSVNDGLLTTMKYPSTPSTRPSMTRTHQSLLVAAGLLLAGQAFMIAVFCFLFFPAVSHGFGPDAEVPEAEGNLLAAGSVGIGLILTALGGWVIARVIRSLARQTSAARPLATAVPVQMLLITATIADGWPLATALTSLLLTVLLASYICDRRLRSKKACELNQ
ncbi:hypothetical protein ACFU76_27305 [Streptomyces sp. NPDC057539]|uniref:hypothetical protein n=1 Tax=Streptomyces sp. NPDC057539 TaxID=3346159 RepID=UPI0036A082AD